MSAGELLLGIESSCDETAAAVVRGGREVLSSVVHSQVEEHAPYGGVVPEVAGRSHLRKVQPVVERALADAGLSARELDAIAVTSRPGLIGSLLVGVSAAKGLAFASGRPLVGVHHIEAHVYAAAMELAEPPWPCLALVVSGGHTALYRSSGPLEHELVATTLDDAAGEAFDKVAWLLGLGYPGGPEVARLAAQGRADAIAFPRHRGRDEAPSFEAAAVDVLVEETLRAARRLELERVLVGGGVACNRRLREQMQRRAAEAGLTAIFPSPACCTDNAVMIAGLGWELLRAGRLAGWELDASAR